MRAVDLNLSTSAIAPSESCSVSPGKPQITLVSSASPGTARDELETGHEPETDGA